MTFFYGDAAAAAYDAAAVYGDAAYDYDADEEKERDYAAEMKWQKKTSLLHLIRSKDEKADNY